MKKIVFPILAAILLTACTKTENDLTKEKVSVTFSYTAQTSKSGWSDAEITAAIRTALPKTVRLALTGSDGNTTYCQSGSRVELLADKYTVTAEHSPEGYSKPSFEIHEEITIDRNTPEVTLTAQYTSAAVVLPAGCTEIFILHGTEYDKMDCLENESGKIVFVRTAEAKDGITLKAAFSDKSATIKLEELSNGCFYTPSVSFIENILDINYPDFIPSDKAFVTINATQQLQGSDPTVVFYDCATGRTISTVHLNETNTVLLPKGQVLYVACNEQWWLNSDTPGQDVKENNGYDKFRTMYFKGPDDSDMKRYLEQTMPPAADCPVPLCFDVASCDISDQTVNINPNINSPFWGLKVILDDNVKPTEITLENAGCFYNANPDEKIEVLTKYTLYKSETPLAQPLYTSFVPFPGKEIKMRITADGRTDIMTILSENYMTPDNNDPFAKGKLLKIHIKKESGKYWHVVSISDWQKSDIPTK